MSKRSLYRLLTVGVLVFSLALAGCEGDDGDTGPPGPQGEPGAPGSAAPPGTSVANETCSVCHGSGGVVDVEVMHAFDTGPVLTTAITSVDFVDSLGNPVDVSVPGFTEAFPRVTFTAALNGAPYDLDVGQVVLEGDPPVLGKSDVRFAIAKLIPAAGGSGDSDSWQNYINRTETPSGTAGPGEPAQPVLATAVQATAERNAAAATLVAGAVPGEFIYTFGQNLATVTTPLAVPFEPALTHRMAIQFGGQPDEANPTFDFVPATGAVVTPPAREIALTASCNECHDKLAFHGGGRIEIGYCVTCHNPGDPANDPAANYNLDAQSGNTIDFKVMIHKLHRGHNLPSVVAGEPYIIWGHNEHEVDYSELGYPQDIRNCEKCHAAGLGADGANWTLVPTMETCTSCHDRTSFEIAAQVPAGFVQHTGGAFADNSSCTLCHPATGGLAGITDSHTIFAELAAADFQNNVVSTNFDAATRNLTINFSVTDPQPGAGVVDPAGGGANWNILTDAPFVQAGGASRLAILVGWDTNEYTNTGSGSAPGLPVSINPLDPANTTDNGDGTFSVSTTVPAGVNAVTVAIEGHPAVTNPDTTEVERIPVANTFANFNTGADPVTRRQVVDLARCNACHENLSLHGNNRQGAIEVCVICHNANATDINRRPAPTETLDMKFEEAIDFKRMIHGVHATAKRENALVVYGFGGSAHEFARVSSTGDSVHYPGILNNCENCHLPGTFVPPLADEVLATTVLTGTDLADPADDSNITRTAAVCSSCHDERTMVGHMELQGASFSIPQENIIQ